MTRGLLVDLDDTLYDYAPAEHAGRAALMTVVSRELGASIAEAEKLFALARARVKSRVAERGCSHSRLLYLIELVHAAERRDLLGAVRAWERIFWKEYLAVVTLREGARELLDGFRARGGRVAIVTDQTAEIQLWKLESMRLFDAVDALVTSEEVPQDKPATFAFELALERLSIAPRDAVMVGDSDARDGGGARALGIPFFRARSSEDSDSGGDSLVEIARKLASA